MKEVTFAAVGWDTRYMAVPLRRLKGDVDELVVFLLTPAATSSIPEVGASSGDGEMEIDPANEERYRAPDEHLEEVQLELTNEVDKVCSALGVRWRSVSISADSDFETALQSILDHLRNALKTYGANCVRQFFLSDTTLTVNVAVVTACYLEGIPLFVADSVKNTMVPIPIIQMRYESGLTDGDMRALEVLQERGGPVNIQGLATLLRRKKNTVSERMTRMEKLGVVRRLAGENGRETLVEILPQGRVLLRASRGGRS